MELIKELTRNEMRNIMAGESDWFTCKCFNGDDHLGTATCTSDMTHLECCHAHWGETNSVECSNSDGPVVD